MFCEKMYLLLKPAKGYNYFSIRTDLLRHFPNKKKKKSYQHSVFGISFLLFFAPSQDGDKALTNSPEVINTLQSSIGWKVCSHIFDFNCLIVVIGHFD